MSGPQARTEITEIGTALGMLCPDAGAALDDCPPELENIPDDVWARLQHEYESNEYRNSFQSAFSNGRAFLVAENGLRGRRPRRVEWKGPHRLPGDDVIPADLRIDHVYLVSCKYLSRVLLNPGPARLFERLLVGEARASVNWFHETAPHEYQRFYEAARATVDVLDLPPHVSMLSTAEQRQLRVALKDGASSQVMGEAWSALCVAVATESAMRWDAALASHHQQLRLLWRLLRISNASYYVLGSDRDAHLRLRVGSSWDWTQLFELERLRVAARDAGQPVVDWFAEVRRRGDGTAQSVAGHVEVRWSHGRFMGAPEAKVYLDTAHADVPGYFALS